MAAPELPALSVVIPTYNAAAWLPDTLDHLRRALRRAAWPNAEIIVVDDGSTDETADVLAADDGVPALTVVHQQNAGRFRAREVGLDRATGELVLFIDARVHAHESSLAFVAEQLRSHPDRRIWNGHVTTATGASLVTRFWDAITFVAWRRYLAAPRLMSYSADEYDLFPKGTTFFLAPTAALRDVVSTFESSYDDLRFANDDTLMIRPLAERDRIHLSPDFSCTYHPRDDARKFVAHSFHRGTVFVDGYYRPGTRFHRPLQFTIAALPVVAALIVRRPRTAATTGVVACAALAGAVRGVGVPTRNAVSLGVLAPVFAVAYGSGIVRGLALKLLANRRSR